MNEEKKNGSSRDIIKERFDAFLAEHGEEPLYAEVTIRFKDDDVQSVDLIKLTNDVDKRDDDKVFYNVDGFEGLLDLLQDDNGEDFDIIDIEDTIFHSKNLHFGEDVEQQKESAVLDSIVENLLKQVRSGEAGVNRDNADGRYVLTVFDRDRSLGYERGFKEVTVGEDLKDEVFISIDNSNAVTASNIPAFVRDELLDFAKGRILLASKEQELVNLIGKGQTFALSEPVTINVDPFVARDVINSISVDDKGSITLNGFRIDEAGASTIFSLEGRDEYDLNDIDTALDAVKWELNTAEIILNKDSFAEFMKGHTGDVPNRMPPYVKFDEHEEFTLDMQFHDGYAFDTNPHGLGVSDRVALYYPTVAEVAKSPDMQFAIEYDTGRRWTEERKQEQIYDIALLYGQAGRICCPKERFDAAVKAIVERAADPSAKAFTPEQREKVQLAAACNGEMFYTPGSFREVFYDRLFSHAQQQMQRVPIAWANDAHQELKELAHGEVRDQGLGLRR